MDALELLRRPECKTIELKRELGSSDRFLHTVVAFANTAGGTVLIGVEDGPQHIAGVEQPLALEERVASLISDSISPRVLPDIDSEVLDFRPASESFAPVRRISRRHLERLGPVTRGLVRDVGPAPTTRATLSADPGVGPDHGARAMDDGHVTGRDARRAPPRRLRDHHQVRLLQIIGPYPTVVPDARATHL